MSTPVTNIKSSRYRAEELLHAIIEGTAMVTGHDFFRSLVMHLATGLGVRYSFIAECRPNHRARALAFWTGHEAGPNFEYDLHGTPCLLVAGGTRIITTIRTVERIGFPF